MSILHLSLFLLTQFFIPTIDYNIIDDDDDDNEYIDGRCIMDENYGGNNYIYKKIYSDFYLNISN